MIGKEHKVVTTTKLAVILVAVILSGCAYLLATCIAREEMKILFIGIDGADWEMVGPLAGQGMLPHFDRLMRSGTSVKVHTAGRKGSPVYWTTIATGQWSKRHGILGFVVKNSQGQGEIPYTSNMRKTKAFWNVLSAKGISVVGRLIDLADENTIVIITADHGLMRKEHTNNGVFIISGPNIRENSWITTRPINLTDICPTLLYLLGVPAARDMDGRVFEEAIAEDYLKYHRIAQVRSYGKRETSNDVPRRSHLDDEIVERLKSLGYLE